MSEDTAPAERIDSAPTLSRQHTAPEHLPHDAHHPQDAATPAERIKTAPTSPAGYGARHGAQEPGWSRRQ